MKIAYVYSTMAKTGGTEKMISEKASYLAEHYGYDVTIISCFQFANQENSFHISKNVKQMYLAIPFFKQYEYKYPLRLWYKWKMSRLLKKSIKKTVEEVDPDILVGVSRFKSNYISMLKCRAKKVVECHETRYNTKYDASAKQLSLTKAFMRLYTFFYFRTIERYADAVVTLTEGDAQLWKKAKRTVVIPNFITGQVCKQSDCTNKRVIAVGRLTWEKGFDRLVKVWGIVSSKHTDWHLDIYGGGSMYGNLMDLAKQCNAQNMTIHDSTPNISDEYATSSICAVTSYYEGFSLVILEAMKHGVPCVAYDCPFGPRSIIDDASNGYLVNDGDTEIFAERLCRLIENEELRKQFSEKAIEKAKTFDADVIMDKCKALYEEMMEK